MSHTTWLLARVATIATAAALNSGNIGAQTERLDLDFGETLEVALVELDVVVRGKDGQPIRGLSRDDFRVLENGSPRPIGGFAERTASWSTPPNSDVHSNDADAIVFFIDHAAIRPDRRARALHFLERYLREAPALLQSSSTRFALATNDQPLSIEIPLTSDADAFLDAIRALPKPPASSAQAALDRARVAREIGGNSQLGARATGLLGGCDGSRMKVLGTLSEYSDAVARRNKRTISGLDALVTIVGGIEGRKLIVYIGEGPELQPGAEMAQRIASGCPDLQMEMLSLSGESIAPELRALAANANSYRVTIYPFDVAGARADELLSPQLRQIRAANQQDSLALLARETGGVFVRNVGDTRILLERVEGDIEHSYSVAYSPGLLEPGVLRDVEIELVSDRFSGARVNHRRTVRAITDTDRLVSGLFAAGWLGIQRNTHALQAEVSEQDNPITITLRIPYSELVLEDDQTEPLSFRFFAMALEQSTSRRTPPKELQESFSVERLAAAKQDGYIEAAIEMELPSGVWRVAVGLRDEQTTRTSIIAMDKLVKTDG